MILLYQFFAMALSAQNAPEERPARPAPAWMKDCLRKAESHLDHVVSLGVRLTHEDGMRA